VLPIEVTPQKYLDVKLGGYFGLYLFTVKRLLLINHVRHITLQTGANIKLYIAKRQTVICRADLSCYTAYKGGKE